MVSPFSVKVEVPRLAVPLISRFWMTPPPWVTKVPVVMPASAWLVPIRSKRLHWPEGLLKSIRTLSPNWLLADIRRLAWPLPPATP